MEIFTPQHTFLISDMETLRSVADPLRTQIYEILINEPANIKQVAERLGTAPSRLYYHVNLMEKLGLLKVVETRMVANMVEKVYRAAAYHIDVAPELLNYRTDEGKSAVTEMLTSGLDATRDDLLRSVQARLFDLDNGAAQKPRQVMVNRTTARVPDEYAEEFGERLRALIEEFAARDSEAGDYQNYALTVAFYPSFYFGDKDS